MGCVDEWAVDQATLIPIIHCSPGVVSFQHIGITWELGRNAKYWASPDLTNQKLRLESGKYL